MAKVFLKFIVNAVLNDQKNRYGLKIETEFKKFQSEIKHNLSILELFDEKKAEPLLSKIFNHSGVWCYDENKNPVYFSRKNKTESSRYGYRFLDLDIFNFNPIKKIKQKHKNVFIKKSIEALETEGWKEDSIKLQELKQNSKQHSLLS